MDFRAQHDFFHEATPPAWGESRGQGSFQAGSPLRGGHGACGFPSLLTSSVCECGFLFVMSRATDRSLTLRRVVRPGIDALAGQTMRTLALGREIANA
jgi:hypothetical protein